MSTHANHISECQFIDGVQKPVPSTRQKLTDLAIPRLPEGTHWDSLLPAFGIRVGKRVRTFIAVHNEGRRIKLGHYPTLTLAAARQAARDAMSGTKSQDTQFLVSTVTAAYLNALDVRPNTYRSYKQFLDKLDRKYGTKTIDQITPRMCAEMIISPHMHVVFKIFFAWARGQAYLTISPMQDIKPIGKIKKRKRKLTDEELKAVWIAAGDLDNYGIHVRLIILLAARRSEIAAAKLKDTTLTFPDTKNHTDHVLPITPYIRELFKEVKPITNWAKPKKKLNKACGFSDWQHRDLRRTTATNLCRAGIKTDVFLVERILNHSMPVLMQIYNQTDWTDDMRSPLQKHQEWLLEMVAS